MAPLPRCSRFTKSLPLRGISVCSSLARAFVARGFLVICGVFGLSGCTADLVGDADSDRSGKPSRIDDLLGETPGGVEISCDKDTISVSPLLKLTTNQYRNTVRDLLDRYELSELKEQIESLLSGVPEDSLGEGFRGLDERVAIEHVQAFFNLGLAVGNALRDEPALASKFATACGDSDTMTDACWTEFRDGFLRSLYRRPLRDEESDSLRQLNEGETSTVLVLRSALIVALSSPRFVYHVEIDGSEVAAEEDLLRLDAYEIASRLSYTFWQTMPDEELFQKAEDGSLLEPDAYAAELERLFNDERSHETVRRFWNEWLKLEKFTGFETARPAFIALAEGTRLTEAGHDYYGDMVQEVYDLTDFIAFEEKGSLSDLLLTRASVTRSADLADLYGVEPYGGLGVPPLLPEGERAGLLQRAALLVSNLEQTNPFHRGALIRRAMLCDPLPQPDTNDLPPGALDPPPFDPEQTTRQRFSAKVDGNSLCENCHTAFSPIGYVLESYDALGRFRTQERVFDEQSGELLSELAIDTTGDVLILSADEPPVQDAAEMNQRIAESGRVEICMAESYFSYFARRARVKSSLDACVIEDLAQVLKEKDGGLASAFTRMARVSTFFTRKVGPK